MDNETIVGYRIVEIKNNQPMSLFHGTNKSRIIPLGQWHKANKVIVRDGSKGKYYESGWHFLPSKEEAESFLHRMFRIKENRFVVKCYLKGNIRSKQHSTKGKCWLADEIKIETDDFYEVFSGSKA